MENKLKKMISSESIDITDFDEIDKILSLEEIVPFFEQDSCLYTAQLAIDYNNKLIAIWYKYNDDSHHWEKIEISTVPFEVLNSL